MVRLTLALNFKQAKSLCRQLQLDTIVKRSTPGLNCPPKLWWAKEIAPELHVSGRLTERQIKYAAEGGFKSVFFLDVDQKGTFAGETLPNSSEITSISSLIGLQTMFITTGTTNSENILNSHSVVEFSKIFSDIEKPSLLAGKTQKMATFLALLYLAHRSKADPGNDPMVTSHDLYKIAASLGYDFTDPESKTLVAKITGDGIIDAPAKPDLENIPVSNYWPAHRIGKNWYTAGQIARKDVPFLERVGFKSLINMRMGVEYAGNPSQEPVTLLNIKDSLPTYDEAKKPTRLNLGLLQNNRVFPNVSPDYTKKSLTVNYEVRNEEEFGDDIGYNENIEREYLQNFPTLVYKHTPFPLPTKDAYTRDMFEQFKDDLISADKEGPVLLHCRIGKRVAYFGILALAIKEGRSLQWAQKRSMEMGHEVSPEARPDIYKIYTEYLQSE